MDKKYYNNIINGVNNHKINTKFNGQIDDLDIKIIHLMTRGNNNKQIATQIKVPLRAYPKIIFL
jgi:hypothetical protein